MLPGYLFPFGSAFHHPLGSLVLWSAQLFQKFLASLGKFLVPSLSHSLSSETPSVCLSLKWESFSKNTQLWLSRKELNSFLEYLCSDFRKRRYKLWSTLCRSNSACEALTQALHRGFVVTGHTFLTGCIFEAENILPLAHKADASHHNLIFSHVWARCLIFVLNKCALESSFLYMTE